MPNRRGSRNPQRQARLDNYTWLRTTQHYTIRQAAGRLGISFRTAQRYEHDLKKKDTT